MRSGIRLVENRPIPERSDRHTVSLISSQRRICASVKYGLELEICEQTRPVRGWVIVACRKGGRYNQLAGVFTSRAFAEAQVVRLVRRWRQKLALPAQPMAASLSYWELEWDGKPVSITSLPDRTRDLTPYPGRRS